ncbi:translation initiation factor IF-3 [Patescibacteria group bacterium]|nr:translation initiation factor IF-3 [Patescibacteria group bacterium]
MAQKYYRINHQITAPTIRLLDREGKQIDVLSLQDALKLAHDNELDLVEISGNAKPPVVKMIEYSKFKYQEAKKAKAEKKGTKGGETKEVQMTPFIGQGDYDTRVKKSKDFLATGNKVKLSIKFHGRQIQKPEFGYQLIERFTNDLAELSTTEGAAKLIGKRLLVTFTPVKKTKKEL